MTQSWRQGEHVAEGHDRERVSSRFEMFNKLPRKRCRTTGFRRIERSGKQNFHFPIVRYNLLHLSQVTIRLQLMKIVLATALYPPDIAPPAPYVKELATRLAANHEVTIVTYGR